MHFPDDQGLYDLITHFVPYDASDCAISVYRYFFRSGNKNKMYVHMKNFLASGFSNIHANVISVRIQFPVEGILHSFK